MAYGYRRALISGHRRHRHPWRGLQRPEQALGPLAAAGAGHGPAAALQFFPELRRWYGLSVCPSLLEIGKPRAKLWCLSGLRVMDVGVDKQGRPIIIKRYGFLEVAQLLEYGVTVESLVSACTKLPSPSRMITPSFIICCTCARMQVVRLESVYNKLWSIHVFRNAYLRERVHHEAPLCLVKAPWS